MTIVILTSVIITLTFAWWTDKSNRILLAHYGYNIDGMNETEFYEKVLPENMERVKGLESSINGVGWSLKALMTLEFYSPYLMFSYLIIYLVGRSRKKNYT